MQSRGAYWRKLDNAAKLFSAASTKRDTRVFRFYCELREEIEEAKLQQALDRTLVKYPMFLSVMRKGLFWHYLEQSNLRPVVRKETREPCRNLYIRDKKELLFEVTYYKKRINFEVFHALTDGTGASEFIRELVKNYLFLVHEGDGLADLELNEKTVTVSDQEDDGFAKYYSRDNKGRKKNRRKAYQIRRNSDLGSLQVTEAEVKVVDLAKKAKEYGVSMTVYLTAVLMCAIHGKMSRRQEEKPVALMVPVNLRKFFPTDSMLNFFSWLEVEHRFGQGKDSLNEVIREVKQYFDEGLTKEKMGERMSEYFALEVHPILRLAPLGLKNFCIGFGSRSSAKEITAIFSNMGIIRMPEDYAKYIERFGVFTSTPKVELCMCSFEENVYLGFTSRFDSSVIKKNFFCILEQEGIKVTLLETEYPKEATADSIGMKVFRIFTFLCIAAAVIALGSDYCVDGHFGLSLKICGGAFSMWLALAVAFFKRYNLLKNAMWQLAVVTTVCTVWDLLTGWHGWSVDFVFPVVSIVIIISMMIISKIYYRHPKQYMIYFVMAAGYGLFFPLVFILTGLVNVTAPSVISIAFSFLTLTALILFKGREFREEMEKTFHV